MSTEIEIKPSKMKIVFRVIHGAAGEYKAVLTTCNDYQTAEKFCWDHEPAEASVTLNIEKVWVPK